MKNPIGYIPEIYRGPITIHITSKIDSETNRGYFGICTTYPHQQVKRWGIIKDLKYQQNGDLLYISDKERSEAIAFLIAFSSIHHSHKKIVTASDSKVIEELINPENKIITNSNFTDIIDTVRSLEDKKRTVSKLRYLRDYDFELISVLETTLKKFIQHDRNKFLSRSSI